MNTIFDYIEWRGDINMTHDPINDVDILILCRLSYIPFDNVVPSSIDEGSVQIKEAAIKVLELENNGLKQFRKEEDKKLLEALIDSERFKHIPLYYYVDIFSEESEEQFSAITMMLEDGSIAVIYRGTDGTLVGWKEDFNMSFSPEVPAQQDAITYFTQVADCFPEKKLRLAGHSKGGNLAMYAATFCRLDIQKRIIAVRNLDGPGFNEHQASKEDFSRISDVTLTYLPESSVIGMLLEHMEKSVIVSSQKIGLFQHNTYLWEIRRSGFVKKEELSNSSRMIDKTLKNWLNNLSSKQREQMVDGLFQILSSTDGKTLRDLWNGKNVISILSAFMKMDEDTKSNIETVMKLFQISLKSNLSTKNMMEGFITEQSTIER